MPNISEVNWHADNPNRFVSGSWSYGYSGLTLSVSASLSCRTAGWFQQDIGLTDTAYVAIDGQAVGSDSYSFPFSSSSAVSYSLKPSGSRTVTAGDHVVAVYMHCSDPNCDIHANVGLGIQIASYKINVPNPYSEISTFTLNSVSPSIGIANETTYTANYTIKGGTNDLTRCIYRLWFRINNIT